MLTLDLQVLADDEFQIAELGGRGEPGLWAESGRCEGDMAGLSIRNGKEIVPAVDRDLGVFLVIGTECGASFVLLRSPI